MRELREFRAHHAEFAAEGVVVAGVSRDRVETNRGWARRFALPYPVLSDRDGALGGTLGLTRRLKIAGWTIELLRRTTLLAGADGRIAAAWGDVKVRGHARAVLETARALRSRDRSAPEAR